MVGNVLLLLGEIVRHNTCSTMVSSNSFTRVCLDILEEQLRVASKASSATDSLATENETEGTSLFFVRRRIAQQSLSGRCIGSDVLTICALTCLQRILDQFANFVTEHFAAIMVTISRLAARYDSEMTLVSYGARRRDHCGKLSSIQHRINQIRKSLTAVEIRLIIDPLVICIDELLKESTALVFLFSILVGCVELSDQRVLSKLVIFLCACFHKTFAMRYQNRLKEVPVVLLFTFKVIYNQQ
ncbi:hypothetical protein AB6A40_011512 [Gnathostoma spinigerum]|uniref:HEAT repeat-containing protein 1 n=1 Tax=Gnathostoma spinigerum TaxID=75299 RepID=A0ABD6EXV6_9BILA